MASKKARMLASYCLWLVSFMVFVALGSHGFVALIASLAVWGWTVPWVNRGRGDLP